MKKTKWLSLAVMLGLAFGLAGCSQKADSNLEKKTQSSQPQQEKIAFAKMANENKTHLWYNVYDEDGLSKSSVISDVIVTKNGKVTDYQLNQGSRDKHPAARWMTLQDTSKLSDKKILEKVKKSDKEYFKEIKNRYSKFEEESKKDLAGLENDDAPKDAVRREEIESARDSVRADHIEANAKYKTPTRNDLRVNVFTDDTGKDVTTEILHAVSFGDDFDNIDEEQFDKGKVVPDVAKFRMTGTMSAPKQILDKYYTGYFRPNSHYLLIRSSKDAQVNFDKQNTKGIVVQDD